MCVRRRFAPRAPVAHLFSYAAGFYYLPANGTAMANVWLIYLEGGQWCAAAAKRPAPLGSDAWPPALRQVLQQRHLLRARAGLRHAGVVEELGQSDEGARLQRARRSRVIRGRARIACAAAARLCRARWADAACAAH